MRLRIATGFWLNAALFAAAVASAAPPVTTLPTLPGAPGATDTAQSQGAPLATVHAATTDKVRKGVVSVELGGRVAALGTVLGTDGRVLTSLTGLGAATEADVRYADNHVVHARIGHKDAQSDLALLVPQTGKWTDGLAASESDPAWVDLRAIGLNQGKLAVVSAKVRGRILAWAKDGSPLPNVLDLDLGVGGTTPGAPLIDGGGAVAGIVVRACKAGDGGSAAGGQCVPVWIGAPVATMRSFLVKTPTNAAQPAPWLGINGAPDASGPSKGVRVVAVAPGSPAEKAGLKAGADLIAAVDGQPVDSPERMSELIGRHAIGETVKLLVLSGAWSGPDKTPEKFREVAIVLKAAP